MSDPASAPTPRPRGPTTSVDGCPDSRRPRRWWQAFLVILVGYALAAVPAFVLLMIAAFGFSGCFIECTQPDPLQGWVGVAGLALVLSAPIIAGVAFMKRRGMFWIPVAVLLAGSLFVLL
ncbi:hypothetical protein JTF08_09730 [Micrococcaceae bacterium RIT802]|nr:hypothetical protein [Micrococcaceae bacterium RIT 802]